MDALRYFLPTLTTLVGVIGFMIGGHWVWLGVGTFPVLMALDILLPRDLAPRRISIPWVADAHLYLQLPLMLALYGAFLYSMVSGKNFVQAGTGWEIIPGTTSLMVGSVLSLVWLSGVPTLPVAHELMHRRHWFPRRLAQVLSTFYMDPNRDMAHVKTHHLELDTVNDSDTPRRGQTIYSFIFSASYGAYKDALNMEAESLRRQGKSPWHLSNRAYQAIVLILSVPAICAAVAGPWAAAVAATAMPVAKAVIEGFNYFQHFGLIRVEGAPIQLHHAWNHLGAIVRPLGSEITNHIHHHLNCYTPFYQLKPEPTAPQMPSLFLCFVLSLIPPVWFKLIAKPRLEDWDRRFATPQERELAMAANQRAGWKQWLANDAAA